MKKISLILILILLQLTPLSASGDKWKDILANKNGNIVFYWYPNNIKIDESKDIIDGVEFDLASSFVSYLNEKYEVEITLDWIVVNSFQEVMDTVQEAESGVFGASSISITDERKKYLNFTPPFLSDVSVLVSSPKVPLAHTAGEFEQIFDNLIAVSIPNTTLDKALKDLKSKYGLHFDILYVSNSGEIIDKIESLENGFGYIDLPNFLVAFDHLSKVRRQFFYPIKLEGIAMIYSLQSDWDEAVNDYFTSNQFDLDRKRIISKYFGEDVIRVVERVATSAEIGPLEEIVISNREKELQYEELLEAANRERERILVNNGLLIAFITAAFILLFLYINFQIKSKANVKLQQQQDTIAKRNSQLQTLNEEKNDLIKILAHDLRSPISNIAGCADLLKEGKGLDQDGEKMIDFISQSSEKMESMIAKILDVDAIDSGNHNLTIEALNVNDLIEIVVNENQGRAKAKGITLTNKSELESPLTIKADQFYTSQIVENLLSNAIKFSKKNTEIKIEIQENTGFVQISVSDQGPGLTKDDKKRIFKKYQVLSAAPTGGEDSVGIGLSIVKLYAEMMGGNVSFESQVGKGTTFYVDLPTY